jgi:hypothetical protein
METNTLGAKVISSPFGPLHWKLTPNTNPPAAREPILRKSRLEALKISLRSLVLSEVEALVLSEVEAWGFRFIKNGNLGIMNLLI